MFTIKRLSVETEQPFSVTKEVIQWKSYPKNSIVSEIVVKSFERQRTALFYLRKMQPVNVSCPSGRTLNVLFFLEHNGEVTHVVNLLRKY